MSADIALAAEPPTRGKKASFTYDAFLSYSHRDEAVAAGIQKGLHRIGRRVGQLNALRVFRDTTDLSANPNLWGRVTDAMDRSRYLIVVLSPRAATPPPPPRQHWVNREVGYWLKQRGPDQLLIVLAEGHLHCAKFQNELKSMVVEGDAGRGGFAYLSPGCQIPRSADRGGSDELLPVPG